MICSPDGSVIRSCFSRTEGSWNRNSTSRQMNRFSQYPCIAARIMIARTDKRSSSHVKKSSPIMLPLPAEICTSGAVCFIHIFVPSTCYFPRDLNSCFKKRLTSEKLVPCSSLVLCIAAWIAFKPQRKINSLRPISFPFFNTRHPLPVLPFLEGEACGFGCEKPALPACICSVSVL